MGLMASRLYVIQGTLLVSIVGPRGGICVLVGRPELELAGGNTLRSRGRNSVESSAEFDGFVAFPITSGRPGIL